MRRLLACCLLTASLTAGEADPLAALPMPPRPLPASHASAPWDPLSGTQLAPGVRLVPGERVVLEGAFQVDKGPVDGLEVLACLREGKTHETLIRLIASDGALIKAAGLAAFGLPDGRPAEESRGVPARGTPVRLTLLWRDEDGGWRSADAATLVRDRGTDRAFPPLPWVWTGSRMVLVTENGPDGKPVRRERFMLDSTRSVAVNYDEPDALLASPFPCASEDQRFEANSAIAPPPRTVVHLAITRAETVLELRLAADGGLAAGAGPLDDAALTTALAAAFAKPVHHAITVRTAAGVGDDLVVAARKRLLAIASAAQVWAVPLFTAE
jgi:hypothetical protein